MRQVIASIEAQIQAAGYPTHFGEVEQAPTLPYVLLWTSPGLLVDGALDGVRDLHDRLGVTMVATASRLVLDMAPLVRAALVGFMPESDAWLMQELRDPFDSQAVQIDRDVDFPKTGYRFFAVDLYRLDGTRK